MMKVNDYNDLLELRVWATDHEDADLRHLIVSSSTDVTTKRATEPCQGLPGFQMLILLCVTHLTFYICKTFVFLYAPGIAECIQLNASRFACLLSLS